MTLTFSKQDEHVEDQSLEQARVQLVALAAGRPVFEKQNSDQLHSARV